MYFQDFNALLTMDGHGAFVWAVYMIALVIIATVLVAPARRRKHILKQLDGDLKRAHANVSQMEGGA